MQLPTQFERHHLWKYGGARGRPCLFRQPPVLLWNKRTTCRAETRLCVFHWSCDIAQHEACNYLSEIVMTKQNFKWELQRHMRAPPPHPTEFKPIVEVGSLFHGPIKSLCSCDLLKYKLYNTTKAANGGERKKNKKRPIKKESIEPADVYGRWKALSLLLFYFKPTFTPLQWLLLYFPRAVCCCIQ